MKTKQFLIRILSLLLALWLLAAPALAVPKSGAEQLALLEEVLAYIDAYALYPAGELSLKGVTARRLEREEGLFLSLVESWLKNDPYGYFMTSDEYTAAFDRSGGQVYGIGIQVDAQMPLGVYIDAFLPGGGAGRSKMEVGAQIVFIGGVDIADAVYMDVRNLFLGERGTSVEVGYINPGSAEIHFEEIRRGLLDVSGVQCTMIEGTDVGYISVDSFSSPSDFFDFEEYYNIYLPQMGARSVIIDLRGNPGGQLEVVYYMLDAMLKEEGYLICRLVDAEGFEELYNIGWTDEDLAEYGTAIWQPDNIVILVDGASASASEVFAGTLQAYSLATVVGETTYGKSHSQYHIDLTSGDMLIITVSRIELYGIGTYEEVGIIPDYEVAPAFMTGAEIAEYPLDATRALFRQSVLTERIMAMQERLAILGFYRAEPSGVFDGYTLWCLNRFQAAYQLPQGRFANAKTLQVLDAAAMAAKFYVDAQMAFALELLGGR